MYQVNVWKETVGVSLLLLLAATIPVSHARPAPGPTPGNLLPPPASTPNSVYKDPCADASRPPVRVSSALACMKSFPFNLTVASATIDTLLKTIPHYVFTDIARASPEPLLPSNVFLEEGLKSIHAKAAEGGYSTEYDFERAIVDLFRSLNDAHTVYTPACFSKWVYTHGVVLMSVGGEDSLKIKVAPAKYQLNSQKSAKYAGWEVVAIDGVPAVESIIEFAERKVGLLKDLNARFNRALFNVFINGSGHEEAFHGLFAWQSVPPSNDFITFLFSNGTAKEELTVPYIALYTGQPFSSQEDYFRLNCQLLPPATRRSLAGDAPTDGVKFHTREVISTATLLKDNVGIVTIPTVYDGGFTEKGLDFVHMYMDSLISGIEELRAAGVKRVILDLTQNGGGFVFLANWLVNALFPGKVNILPTRFRANPLAVLAVEAANATGNVESQYHWSNWASAETNAQFQSLEDGFFFPTVNLTFGGVENQWSQLLKDRQAADFVPLFITMNETKPFGETPPFAAEDMLILTNGYCGSSCSIIASSLSQFHGVRTVTVGGIPGQPQQISNFPGSQVILKFEDFQKMLQDLGLENHALAPQPFLRQANVGFTWRALFGPISEDTPLEFVFEPSTFNLDYTDATATSPLALWEEVAKLF